MTESARQEPVSKAGVARKPAAAARLVDLGCEMRQVGHAQDTPMEPCLLADLWRGISPALNRAQEASEDA